MAESTSSVYRIHTSIDRLPPEVIAPLGRVGTGQIVDAMGRSGAMHHGIRTIAPGIRLLGSALTVKARPKDNLIVYKALQLARPGDVLVVAIEDYAGASVWGDLTTRIAMKQGVAGLVTDGMVRDAAEIRALGFPLFCRGFTPNSPLKDGPGEINVPISCGGVPVFPGDVVVGDDDGVVVVPRAAVSEVASRALAIVEAEAKKEKAIEAGEWLPPDIDERLRKQGCLIE